jgi:hypothetical protein
MREPQEVECPREFPPFGRRSFRIAVRPLERHQPRLVGMDRQATFRKPFGKNRQNATRNLFMAKTHDKVVRVADQIL